MYLTESDLLKGQDVPLHRPRDGRRAGRLRAENRAWQGKSHGAPRPPPHRALVRRGRLRLQPSPALLRALPLRCLDGDLG